MNCDQCHSDLFAARDNRCPACGQPFDPADRRTFRPDRFTPSPRERYRGRCDLAIVALSFLLALVIAVTVFHLLGLFDR